MNFHQTRVIVETVLPLCSTLKFRHPVKVCAFLRNRPSRLARKRELASDNRLIISIRWRLPFYAFSSQPGTILGKSFQKIGKVFPLHWANVSTALGEHLPLSVVCTAVVKSFYVSLKFYMCICFQFGASTSFLYVSHICHAHGL
jgi:hypothetical protein